MGEKSAQKRQLIIDAARPIFVEKGFKDVTMKDIVDACQISRGGLYLYFSSTAELFEEIMRQDASEADDVFEKNLEEDATIADVLMIFLKEQKREILRRKNDLSIARYEYFFTTGTGENNVQRQKFDEAVTALSALIEAGVENGEFYCEDPQAEAGHIMYVLEGLRISAHTMGLTEANVDSMLLTLMRNLVIE